MGQAGTDESVEHGFTMTEQSTIEGMQGKSSPCRSNRQEETNTVPRDDGKQLNANVAHQWTERHDDKVDVQSADYDLLELSGKTVSSIDQIGSICAGKLLSPIPRLSDHRKNASSPKPSLSHEKSVEAVDKAESISNDLIIDAETICSDKGCSSKGVYTGEDGKNSTLDLPQLGYSLTANALLTLRVDESAALQTLQADFSYLAEKLDQQDDEHASDDSCACSFTWKGTIREDPEEAAPKSTLKVHSPYIRRIRKPSQERSAHYHYPQADAEPTSPNTSRKQLMRSSSFSEGSPIVDRRNEMMRYQQELGMSSQAFIEGLRGAAFRRKLNLTRSRDSLMAKERHQLETNRSFSSVPILKRRESEPILPSAQCSPAKQTKLFRAKPMPKAVTEQGRGGLAGVPKVDKRPTTTPFSPLLGARRQFRKLVGRGTPKLPPQDMSSVTFKARPLPRSNTDFGRGGLAGIPKVPKRPTTVPFSPLLGSRRPQNVADFSQSKPTRHSTGSSYTSGKASPVLAGLGYLSGDAADDETQENKPPSAATTPSKCAAPRSTMLGYQPHSTARAKKRAEFERQKLVHEQQRLEAEQADRAGQVKALQKELKVLRESL